MNQEVETPECNKYMGFSGSPILDMEGDFEMGLLYTRDKEAYLAHEKKIKKQRDFFYRIFDEMEIPILALSYPDFKISVVNNKSIEIIKMWNGDVAQKSENIKYGGSILDVFPHFFEGENNEYIQKLIETKDRVYNNKFRVQINDDVRYYKVIYQPLFDNEENIREILIAMIDITNNVIENEGLKSLLKMQEEFFSFIAHEFKTPIAVTSAAIQAMEYLCKNEMSERSKGFVKKIKQSGMQQIRLINNLLDITRMEAGYLKTNKKNMDIVSVTRMITKSVGMYAKEKGVNLKFTSTIRKKIMAVDDEKYERILLNLLSNAIKFTPQGKSICVRLSSKKDSVSIEVKDEGTGIPVDKQRTIFEKFGQVNNSLTRRSEGTGIGLCLVKMLVNTFGGEILLESNEGKGSTFTIILPAEIILNSDENSLLPNLMDNRLVENMKIEFSNIYTGEN